MYYLLEKVFMSILGLFVIVMGLFVIVGFVVCATYLYKESNCIRRENQLVHHEAWTQIVPVGKAMIPIFHPAYEAVEAVCVEYAE